MRIWQVIDAVKRRLRHQSALIKARKLSKKSINERDGNNILVLCYGNIYRSPLLSYLLNNSDELGSFTIRSSGFHNKSGRSCEDSYLSLLSQRGHDLHEHRSSLVSVADLDWADVIVIMDRRNWDMVGDLDSIASQKIVWVGGLSKKGSVEIEDPYGKNRETVLAIVYRLEQCSRHIASALKSLDVVSTSISV